MHDDIDYEGITERVTRRVQRRYRFFFHTVIFIICIPILARWNSPELFLVWVGLWASHLLWMNYQMNLEHAIAEEIERERLRQYKDKRDAEMLYGEYGEADDTAYNVYETPGPYAHEEQPRWLGDDGEFAVSLRYDTDD